MDDVTFIVLKTVVSVAAALITAYLIPFIKSKIKNTQNEEIFDMIDIAVKAAEQTLTNGDVKKEQVLDTVSKWLIQRGLKVSKDQLDKMVEAAVYSMNNENPVFIELESAEEEEGI